VQEVLKKLHEEIKKLESVVVSSSCKDFVSYKEVCGQIKAYLKAMEIVKEYERSVYGESP
jgi:hypothetical protein